MAWGAYSRQSSHVRHTNLICAGVVFDELYLASSLYHGVVLPHLKAILEIVDHSAIYLLIAGSVTPIALLALNNSLRQRGLNPAIALKAALEHLVKETDADPYALLFEKPAAPVETVSSTGGTQPKTPARPVRIVTAEHDGDPSSPLRSPQDDTSAVGLLNPESDRLLPAE